jgi:hypothetical protein
MITAGKPKRPLCLILHLIGLIIKEKPSGSARNTLSEDPGKV